MSDQRTRHSQRTKIFASSLKTVDQNQRQLRLQTRIDALESDFYDSPNKLAEDEISDEFDLSEEDDDDRRGRKKRLTKKKVKKKKKGSKRIKIQNQLRKNLNLKKLLKEENINQEDKIFPNFVNLRSKPTTLPIRKYCSICGLLGKYTCPRCGESYCNLECQMSHKEIQCLRVDY